jgi:hypothetical protein
MTETEVTIANGAGLILSLVCSYVPGAKQKYAALDGTGKRLVMLGLLALAVAGIYMNACIAGASLAPLLYTNLRGRWRACVSCRNDILRPKNRVIWSARK